MKVNPNYDEKAHELISQVLSKSSCNCMLEISKESMIKISKTENPGFNIQDTLIKELELNNRSSLDSLEKLSDNFSLNKDLLKQKQLQLIQLDSLKFFKENPNWILKMCPKGILIIQKPIFNKYYQIAAVDYNYAFTCLKMPIVIYRFKEGRWVQSKIL